MSRFPDSETLDDMERASSPLAAVTPLPVRDATPLDLDSAFRRYARYVAAVALRLLARDDEVDDVVQEVFLTALRKLGSLRDPDAIRGWLATVTVRVAGRRLRRRKMWAFFGVGTEGGYEEVAATGATAEDRALLARVYAVLDGLPVAERIAWTLRHVEGERLEQVAALCGCSLATAKRRIAAAHATVERMLSDE